MIHAGKPEPNTETPQAGTAHETAYDFFAEFPETLHTVFWVRLDNFFFSIIYVIQGLEIY